MRVHSGWATSCCPQDEKKTCVRVFKGAVSVTHTQNMHLLTTKCRGEERKLYTNVPYRPLLKSCSTEPVLGTYVTRYTRLFKKLFSVREEGVGAVINSSKMIL